MNLPANKSEIVPWLLSGWRLIAVLVAVLVIGLLLWWAYSGSGKDKELPIIANIGVDNGKNAVITNLVTNQQEVVNNAANNANQAGNAVNVSINRPSTEFNRNGAVVSSRFCRDFPDDPSCH